MAVNVKMGGDIGGFTSGIREGQQILKGLNAEMKATEAEFKATGNAEQKMASQTKNLTSQIQVQKGIVDQAQKALDAMAKAGIDPADKAYQQMYATMDIGIIFSMQTIDKLNHALRLLRRSATIQVNQRFTIDLSAEDWEILSYELYIKH